MWLQLRSFFYRWRYSPVLLESARSKVVALPYVLSINLWFPVAYYLWRISFKYPRVLSAQPHQSRPKPSLSTATTTQPWILTTAFLLVSGKRIPTSAWQFTIKLKEMFVSTIGATPKEDGRMMSIETIIISWKRTNLKNSNSTLWLETLGVSAAAAYYLLPTPILIFPPLPFWYSGLYYHNGSQSRI